RSSRATRWTMRSRLSMDVLPRGRPVRTSLDPLLVALSFEDVRDEDARRDDRFRIERARLDKLFDLGNRSLRSGRHHRVEIGGGAVVDQVAEPIAFPRLDERNVGEQRRFEHIPTAVDLTYFLAVRHNRAVAGGREKAANACAARPDALGERALG